MLLKILWVFAKAAPATQVGKYLSSETNFVGDHFFLMSSDFWSKMDSSVTELDSTETYVIANLQAALLYQGYGFTMSKVNFTFARKFLSTNLSESFWLEVKYIS